MYARPADVFGVVVAQQLRDPHVRHLGGAPVLGQQHVGRLDVAVDDLASEGAEVGVLLATYYGELGTWCMMLTCHSA